MLNELQAKDGDTSGFSALMAMTKLQEPAQYQKVERMLDIPGFIDYLLVNFYGGNHDWGESKNWYAIGRRHDPQQFRFFCWDSEFILQDLSDDVVGSGSQPFRVIGELRANPDFMISMADQIQKQFFGDGPLTPKAAADLWMKRAQELDLAIIAESARWGEHRRTPPYTRDKDWIAEQQRLLTNWFPQRTSIVLEQLRQAGFYPAIDPPRLECASRTDNGALLFMSSVTNSTIYFSTNGVDPRLQVKGVPAPSALVFSNAIPVSTPVTIKARARRGDVWSALVERAL